LLGGVNPSGISLPATGAVPSSTWLFDPPFFSCAAFRGIESDNIKPYIRGLSDTTGNTADTGIHQGFLDAFRTHHFSAAINKFLACNLQLLTGHSLGGATVISLAAVLPRPGPGRQRGVVTFGSPRPFAGLRPSLKDCTSVFRWMVPGDSITRFPPRGEEGIAVAHFIARYNGLWPEEWYQPEGGRLFDRRGSWTDAAFTGSLATADLESFTIWAAGGPSSLSRRHEFGRYAQDMLAVTDGPEGFWSRPLDKGGMESPSFANPPITFAMDRAALGFPIPNYMGCNRGVTTRQPVNVSQGPPL